LTGGCTFVVVGILAADALDVRYVETSELWSLYSVQGWRVSGADPPLKFRRRALKFPSFHPTIPSSYLIHSQANMPIYEVASWTASDALLKDKATLKAGMDHSIRVEGCLGYAHPVANKVPSLPRLCSEDTMVCP